MELLQWNQKFSVGNQDVDLQHKKLFELLNHLITGSEIASEHDKMNMILEKLVAYTDYHFAFEEGLMKNHPLIEVHRKVHGEFVEKIGFFQEKFNSEKEEINGELFSFLVDWLRDHILETDAIFLSELAQDTV